MMNKINGMKESLSYKKLHLRGDLLYLNCYDFKSKIATTSNQSYLLIFVDH